MKHISISQEKEKNKQGSLGALLSLPIPIGNLNPRAVKALRSLFNCHFSQIFFSQQTIADYNDYSPSTVKRAIKDLIQAKLIVAIKRRYKNSNIYTLNPLLNDPEVRHWLILFFKQYFALPIKNLLSKARSVASGLLCYLNNKIIYLFTTKVRRTFGGPDMVNTTDSEKEKNIVFNADGIPICFDSSYHQVEWQKKPLSSLAGKKTHNNRKSDYQSTRQYQGDYRSAKKAYEEPGGLSRYKEWTPPPAPPSCTNQEFKEVIEQVTDPIQLAFLRIMAPGFNV